MKRSKKILITCHCVLNANTKIYPLAQEPGVFIKEIMPFIESGYTRTFRAFEVYLAVGALYFIIIYAVSFSARMLEDRLNGAERLESRI